jgi:uncharacterized protein YndB with AHSA1/START domain
MRGMLSSEVSILLNSPVGKVWQALIDPEQIKQYLFGTQATSDWKKGSPITYIGEWEGRQYEDKGRVIEIVPNKLLHTTYWSSMSGKEDKPENYNNVIYKVDAEDGQTKVTITQDNIKDEAEKAHMIQNWTTVLQSMKKLLEG